jgi:predicted metal-dependent phosphoesterase TrpH
MTPSDLFAAMADAGMAVVAISDHDTLAGVRELREAGLGGGLGGAPRLVPALEVNTVGGGLLDRAGLGRDGEELHILGYGIDVDDAAFEATLARQRQGRLVRLALTLDRLRDLGLPVDEQLAAQELTDLDARGRPHVARALVSAGHAASVDDAFARYLEPGRPAYVPRQGLGPRAAIDAIRAAGGIAVLAHPYAAAEQPQVVSTLVQWGVGGLEAHYRAFPDEVVGALVATATAHGLLVTGGSDYHGDTMSYAEAAAGTRVPDGLGEALLAALER